MKETLEHGLGQALAKRTAEAAWTEYRQRLSKYNPTLLWEHDHRALIGFKAKGITVRAIVEISDQSIRVELQVPFLMRPFKGRAVSVVQREVSKWIAKARAGEI